jgi:hypothetical protein
MGWAPESRLGANRRCRGGKDRMIGRPLRDALRTQLGHGARSVKCDKRSWSQQLFYDLIGAAEQNRRHIYIESFGCLQVYEKLKLCRALDRQLFRLHTF